MSLWTMEEVQSLEDKNGGGNRAAQHMWLAEAVSRLPPGVAGGMAKFESESGKLQRGK